MKKSVCMIISGILIVGMSYLVHSQEIEQVCISGSIAIQMLRFCLITICINAFRQRTTGKHYGPH